MTGLQELTLSKSERDAFDFIGDRYCTGRQVKWILQEAQLQVDAEWDEEGDITYHLTPKDISNIYYLSQQEDHQWPLLGRELKNKMNELIQLPY